MKRKGILLLCTFIVLTLFLCGSVAHSEDVAALNTAIQARGGKWVAGETSMSRLSPAEQARRLGLLGHSLFPPRKVPVMPQPGVALPTKLDWRNNGGNYVTSVKNQGSCGSCWAFAATGATESNRLLINGASNTDLDLSEQALVSCSGGGSCAGGYPDQASEYIRTTGLPVESCFPYTGMDSTCSYSCNPSSNYKIQGWTWVVPWGTTPTTDALKNALYTNGPLIVTMAVYADFFNYAGGIYTTTSGYLAGYHAIVLVGYNDQESSFTVKNSWGTGWGEQGYFRIAYSELTGLSQFGYETIAYTLTLNNYALSVSKAGTGTGSVTSYPSGINCGSTCTANYAKGTLVTLTATPDAVMTFAGWSGACSGTGTCTVTMDAVKSVTATFNLAGYTLYASKAGTGTGSVTSYPSGINCGSTCTAHYATGTQVTLTATPNANVTFAGWAGGVCSGTGTCTVTMDATKYVTAYFNVATGYTLSVAKSGTGTGTVTSNPSGINCGTACSASFASGSQVTLSATPDAHMTFAGWSGACSGTGTCTVTMNAGQSVAATFSAAAVYMGCYTDSSTRALPTELSGGGETVESCMAKGAAAGFTYVGVQWYGECWAGNSLGFDKVADSECNTPCNANPAEMCGGAWHNSIYQTTVNPPSNYALSVSRAGTGTGTVISNPSGINCGSTCTANYTAHTQVTLTATPDASMTFAGWSGACSGTGTCAVTMDAAKSVTATFSTTADYMGCYTDSSTRALPNCLSTGGETVESCKAKAAAAGFTYAGVQWYGECWAGNSLGFDKVADSECNTPCNANPAEMCGGAWHNSIYLSHAHPSNYTLTVVKAGAAPGTVTSSPAGISCGFTCSSNYAAGTQVTLTATPNVNVTFAGWSGACSGTGTCTVTMDAAKAVTATFNVSPDSAYYCYSPSYANYGYQTWLCNAMYQPTICYTINWQLTTCPQ